MLLNFPYEDVLDYDFDSSYEPDEIEPDDNTEVYDQDSLW